QHAVEIVAVDRERLRAGSDHAQVALRNLDRTVAQRDRAAAERGKIDAVATLRPADDVAQAAFAGVVAVGDLPRRTDTLQLERADVGGRADHARAPQSALVELVFVGVVALVDRWAGGRQRVSPGGSAVGGERQEP